MKNIRKTKIIGTIGPASESEEMFRKLVQAGLNVARINFSHGGFEENREKIATIKRVRDELGLPISLCLDTKGPEIRTGRLGTEGNKIQITEGQEFTFVMDDIEGDETKISVTYPELYKEVTPGSKILVDDGEVEFEVKEIRGTDIVCEAKNTFKMGQRKTMNIPGVTLELPALSDKDRKDIAQGVEAGFDYIFASFIRRADDVRQIRELLDANGGQEVGIISKIESQEGIDNFEEILALSDGIMVARGDMGIEIPMEEVPIVQKKMIRRCNEVGKPVITATQMLESMIENPRPTRAEVSDVANSVYDLTGAIMLSGECAMGKYPIECVQTMDKIAVAIETQLKYWKRFDAKGYNMDKRDLKANISYAAADTAQNIDADAIVAYTHIGTVATWLAGLNPACPVIAITDNRKTFYKLGIVSNTMPILIENQPSINDTLEVGIKSLEEKGILEKGDTVVVAGGSRILSNEKQSQIIGGIMYI